MDKDLSRSTGANELLHRHAIEAACDNAQRSYDFGLSNSDDLRRFKSSFGTFQEPVHTYHFEQIPIAAIEAKGRQFAKQMIRKASTLTGVR